MCIIQWAALESGLISRPSLWAESQRNGLGDLEDYAGIIVTADVNIYSPFYSVFGRHNEPGFCTNHWYTRHKT